MQKTFEELTRYHNSMIEEKARFIAEELPALESKCRALEDEEEALSKRSSALRAQVSGMLEEGDLRRLIDEQNDLFHRKGEYDARIGQLSAAHDELEATEKALQRLEDESQADGLEHLLARQVSAFNKHFAAVSEHLYGEAYVLAFERTPTRPERNTTGSIFSMPRILALGKSRERCFASILRIPPSPMLRA